MPLLTSSPNKSTVYKNSVQEVEIMARLSDIKAAFCAAVQLNPKGYQCLKTSDFISELAARNWHFTRADANEWIGRNQGDFVDKTPTHSDDRYWMLRAMGRIR